MSPGASESSSSETTLRLGRGEVLLRTKAIISHRNFNPNYMCAPSRSTSMPSLATVEASGLVAMTFLGFAKRELNAACFAEVCFVAGIVANVTR